jgi:hypothetical protein
MTANRVWMPKPEYRRFVHKLSYTDAELVEFFLNITHHWYEDKENLLFGWRDRVRDELLRCIRENDDEANDPHQLIYPQMKFQMEWIGPEGMFTSEKSPWEVGLPQP